MRMPTLGTIKQTTDGVTKFTGLDHNLKVAATAFYDMRNMTGEQLPVMSTRRKRAYLRRLKEPNGLFAHDALCWVDGTAFYYNGEVVGQVEDSEKQFARMGALVLCWPDAVYYNTQTGEFGQLGAKTTVEGVSCHLCRADGEAYGEYTVGEEAPEKPENGALWLDTSEVPNVMRAYSSVAGMWNAVPTVYTRINAEGIGAAFAQFDGIEIHGMADEALNGSFYVVDRGEDHLIVIALVEESFTQETAVTVERKIPQMDYICERGNRLWGCSSEKHEIYASALGDAKNWYQFIGQDSDSWAATVGSAGDFTGCCTHQGDVLFFKEKCIHTVQGYVSSNFQIDTTSCYGVQKGSGRSVASLNGRLLFKGVYDVCAMESTLPMRIGTALGDRPYTEAAAGTLDACYYLSMRDERGRPRLFVYNTWNGRWTAEDEADARWFAAEGGELYMLLSNGELWSVRGGGIAAYGGVDAAEEKDVAWMLDTGDVGIDEPYNRFISGIQLYCGCELGTRLTVEARCDHEPTWREVFRTHPATRTGMTIPYVPPRCRTIRLRLKGTGGFQLYQIVKKTQQGSDVY